VIPCQKEEMSQKGVFMKNTFKLFCVITTVAVIVFSMAACQVEKDGNDGMPKAFLYITGLPVGEDVKVYLCTNTADWEASKVAYSEVIHIEKSEDSIPLYSEKKEDFFTGTGSYYIFLFFNGTDPDSSSHYHYTYEKWPFSGFPPVYIEFTAEYFNNLE